VSSTDRNDVTISSATVEGKSSGAGIHCSIGPDAPPGGFCVVEKCTVKGASPGIELDGSGSQGVAFSVSMCTSMNCNRGAVCDMTGATGATCTVSNYTATSCKTDGLECFAGADGGCTLADISIERCGSGPQACGMNVGGLGGFFADARTDVRASKGAAVRVTKFPTICEFDTLTVDMQTGGSGMVIAPDCMARLVGEQYPWIVQHNIFVSTVGDFAAPQSVFDAAFSPILSKPPVDVAPPGWDPNGVATFDADGNLTVHVPSGATEVYVYGGANAFAAQPVDPSTKTATFAASDLPAGSVLNVVPYGPVHPELNDTRAIFGGFDVKPPKPKKPSGNGTFDFSQTSFTLHVAVNNDTSAELDITNKTSQQQTALVSTAKNGFGVVPNGELTFQPNEMKKVDVEFSTMTPGTVHSSFTIQFGGKVIQIISLTAIAQ
jgi:hypothetical protein